MAGVGGARLYRACYTGVEFDFVQCAGSARRRFAAVKGELVGGGTAGVGFVRFIGFVSSFIGGFFAAIDFVLRRRLRVLAVFDVSGANHG